MFRRVAYNDDYGIKRDANPYLSMEQRNLECYRSLVAYSRRYEYNVYHTGIDYNDLLPGGCIRIRKRL